VSLDLTIPSDRTQTTLRWVVCFAVVLGLHVGGIAKLLEQSDFADAPPGSEAVELDLALGDPQEQIDPIQYTPPKPVEQEVKPQQEPEQKEAEVALPKEVQPETPTPVEATPPQEEQEAKAPPKVSAEVVRKWQMTVNTRLNQYKRYPTQARTRHHEGTFVVAFTLDTDGHVVNSKIVKSSGSALLDQETLDLLARAQPFPVPPNGAGGQDLFLQVPIAYGLR
jgi:periplasmic protein TonB